MSEIIPEKKQGKKKTNKYRNFSHKSAIKAMIPEGTIISTRGLDILNDLVSYFFVQLKKNCYHLLRFVHAKKLSAQTVKLALPLFYFNVEINGRNQTQEIIKEIDQVLPKWEGEATNKNTPETITISPSKIERHLKENMESFMLSSNGIKAATVAVNFFTNILIAKVIRIAQKYKKKKITPHHIKIALKKDLALSFLFADTAVMFGGVDEDDDAPKALDTPVPRVVAKPAAPKAAPPKAAPSKKASAPPKAAPSKKASAPQKAAPRKSAETEIPPKTKKAWEKNWTKREVSSTSGKEKLSYLEHNQNKNRYYRYGKSEWELTPPYWPTKCPSGQERVPRKIGNCEASKKATVATVSPVVSLPPGTSYLDSLRQKKKQSTKKTKAAVPIPQAPATTLKQKIQKYLGEIETYRPGKLLGVAILGERLGNQVSDDCAKQNLGDKKYKELLSSSLLVHKLAKAIQTRGDALLEYNINEEQKALVEEAIEKINNVSLALKVTLKQADNECHKYRKAHRKPSTKKSKETTKPKKAKKTKKVVEVVEEGEERELRDEDFEELMEQSPAETPVVAMAKKTAILAQNVANQAREVARVAEEESSSDSDTVSSSQSSPIRRRASPQSPAQGMIPRAFRKK